MFGRVAVAATGLLLLAACAQMGGRALTPADLAPDSLRGGYGRAVEQSFGEAPFANGALAVIAPGDQGDLATFRLVPCGQAVCAGSAQGPAGQLRRTPDWVVVTGLYGRTFWLNHGGDGYVERGDRFLPLAWNARPNGTGDGDVPALETPYPHGELAQGDRAAPLPASRVLGLGGGRPPAY